jgi:hypothetical protein
VNIELETRYDITVAQLLTIFLLWTIACSLTLSFHGFYNQDLGVSVFVIENLQGITFFEAFETNSIIFYLLKLIGDSFLFNKDYLSLMFWFYIVAQIYIITSLVRYSKAYNALVIILIVFFTIILNQMRFGIAISLMLSLISKDAFISKKDRYVHLAVCIVIILFHVFVGVFYVLYLVTRKRNYLVYVFGVVLLIGYSSLRLLLADSRFLFYLDEDASRGSFSFLLFFAIYAVSYISLDKFHRLFFLFLLLVSGASYSLPAISSRLSELSIVFLLIILSKFHVSVIMKILLLTFASAFFLYRCYNWFVLGLVPLAP